MNKFCGKSKQFLKTKNRPIKEGFKIWKIADHGYVWSWLFYSLKEGTERIGKKTIKFTLNQVEGASQQGTIALASTYAVVLSLAKGLVDFYSQPFTCLLDNLFLNVNVARCLLNLKITCHGTIRQDAQPYPQELKNLKKSDKAMLWDTCTAQVQDGVLCWLWQDNNVVLGLTTAHSLHKPLDTVLKKRKRPWKELYGCLNRAASLRRALANGTCYTTCHRRLQSQHEWGGRGKPPAARGD